jgi:perosamine synthetase
MIPIYKPYLPKHILEYSYDALNSTWISSNGEYLNKSVEKLKDLFGYKYILLANNGTTAGHLMAIGLNYKFKTTKIVVPNNVYIAAWNAFKMNPIYDFEIIDSNLDTWCGDYEKFLENNPENNTILIVPNINSIINVPYLKNKYPNNIFIEDNCEGFLGKYNNKYTGTESYISSVSFFGNKNITSGEGGAVMFSDDSLFNYLNSVRCQGYTDEKFIFDKLGYNYRMTNVQAALIYGQLLHINEIIEMKNNIFNLYYENLKNEENIIFQKTADNTNQSNWMFGLRFKNFNIDKFKKLELHLYENSIETRKMFPPMTYHKHYSNEKCDISNSKIIYESTLILPSFPELNKYQISKICDIIKNTL